MRKDSLAWCVLLSGLLTTGCSLPFMGDKDASAKPGASLFSSQRDALNNQQPSTWRRFTRPLTDNALVNKMRSAKPAYGSDAVKIAKNDPTSLSTKRQKLTPDMFIAMGSVLEKSGRSEEALQQYQKALSIDGRNLDALLGYGHVLDRKGRLNEAREKYELACRYHPQSGAAWNDLGLCLARSNQLSHSLEALNRAVSIGPQRKLYRNNIATVLAEMGRPQEALQHLAAVHGEAAAHFNLGHLLQKRGDVQSATQYLARTASLDASFAGAHQQVQKILPAAYPAPAGAAATSMPAYQPLPNHTQAVNQAAATVGSHYQSLYRQQQNLQAQFPQR